MIRKVFKLTLDNGMHARPAGLFIKTIGPLNCDVQLIVNKKSFNGKSIMAILSGGFRKGEIIEVICDGSDEVQGMEEITTLFATNFNE